MRRRFEKRVYIPLPSEKDIVYILKNSLDKVGHNINNSGFNEIGKKLKGFSGSDVATFVKQCCMMPLDKTVRATHFRQVNVDGEAGWVCCGKGDKGSVVLDVGMIGGSNIFPPEVEFEDLIYSLENTKRSVGDGELERYVEFTKEFGMEG